MGFTSEVGKVGAPRRAGRCLQGDLEDSYHIPLVVIFEILYTENRNMSCISSHTRRFKREAIV